MLLRAIRGVGSKLMCLLVCGLWSPTFIATCFHVLLCCHSGQLQSILFCPGHLSRTSNKDFLCFVLFNQRLVNGWEDNHGHCTAFKVTGRGLFCDKYIYFSLKTLCDRSSALACHHPWESLQEIGGVSPPLLWV